MWKGLGAATLKPVGRDSVEPINLTKKSGTISDPAVKADGRERQVLVF